MFDVVPRYLSPDKCVCSIYMCVRPVPAANIRYWSYCTSIVWYHTILTILCLQLHGFDLLFYFGGIEWELTKPQFDSSGMSLIHNLIKGFGAKHTFFIAGWNRKLISFTKWSRLDDRTFCRPSFIVFRHTTNIIFTCGLWSPQNFK